MKKCLRRLQQKYKKKTNENSSKKEIEDCFELLSKFHDCSSEEQTKLRHLKDDCGEEHFKLRYEAMRNLKEEKNMQIEALNKVVEDVKLENATLNFIVSTIENPELVSQVIDENMKLSKENKELKSVLEIRNLKIRGLEQQPKIQHIWQRNNNIHKSVTAPKETQNGDVSEKHEDDISHLERVADLKLSGHTREDPQTSPTAKANKKELKRRFICNKCNKDHNNSEELEDHLDIHCEDGDYTCDTCLFQCNKIQLLKHHLQNSPGHSSGQVRGRAAQKCNICEEKFLTKTDLMTHVDLVHPSFKPCRDYQRGICKRTKCRYKHRIIKEGNCVCFQCGKDFNDKLVMMKHIKLNHGSAICKMFQNNMCDREDGTEYECWFTHSKNIDASKKTITGKKADPKLDTTMAQGFHRNPLNQEPPIHSPDQESILKAMEERVLKTVSHMIEGLIEKMKLSL